MASFIRYSLFKCIVMDRFKLHRIRPYYEKKSRTWLAWELTALGIGILLYIFAYQYF
jgi:hypothetical protein